MVLVPLAARRRRAARSRRQGRQSRACAASVTSVKRLRCRAPEPDVAYSKRSDVLQVRRSQLAALGHNVVGELLAFVQIAHAGPLDCGDMDEYVRSAIGRLNESKALL